MCSYVLVRVYYDIIILVNLYCYSDFYIIYILHVMHALPCRPVVFPAYPDEKPFN